MLRIIYRSPSVCPSRDPVVDENLKNNEMLLLVLSASLGAARQRNFRNGEPHASAARGGRVARD